MRTALDAPVDTLDRDEQSFVAKVKEYGWFDTHIFADAEGPGFSFTTGIWLSTRQPELIMFATKHEIAHNVFWSVSQDAKAGTALQTGRRTNAVFANLAAYAFPVAKRFYPDLLGWSRWFYGGDDFPCLQIVWPDPEGVFPWEDGFDQDFVADQPDLTEHGWQRALAS